jgi:hypothetical protein
MEGRGNRGTGTDFEVVDSDAEAQDTGRTWILWGIGGILVLGVAAMGVWGVVDENSTAREALEVLNLAGEDEPADWKVLGLNVTSEGSDGETRFRFEAWARDANGSAVSVSGIEAVGRVHYMETDEPIRGLAENDSRWETCRAHDCSFTVDAQSSVQITWDRTGKAGAGMTSDNVFVNLANESKTVSNPSGWTETNPWTGEHSWSITKADPVTVVPFEELNFEVANSTLVDKDCESKIAPKKDCFRVNVTVTSTGDEAGQFPVDVSWNVTYENREESEFLPFVDDPDGEMQPQETRTIRVGVPIGEDDEPSSFEIFHGDSEPVALDLQPEWRSHQE